MLHNKSYEILKYFLEDYGKELYGRELFKHIGLSQKNVAITLVKLEKEGILKSRKSGNIKYYKLNLLDEEIKDIIIVLEIMRKIYFFLEHRKIANLFKKDNRIIGIFGSYAKGTQKKESDIDIFIIGNKLKEDYNILGKRFDLNISIKYFSEKEFRIMLKNKNNLGNEIVKNHIIIFGIENFINLIWGDYYGFN